MYIKPRKLKVHIEQPYGDGVDISNNNVEVCVGQTADVVDEAVITWKSV